MRIKYEFLIHLFKNIHYHEIHYSESEQYQKMLSKNKYFFQSFSRLRSGPILEYQQANVEFALIIALWQLVVIMTMSLIKTVRCLA